MLRGKSKVMCNVIGGCYTNFLIMRLYLSCSAMLLKIPLPSYFFRMLSQVFLDGIFFMSISKPITLSSSGDQRHLVRAGTAYGTSVSGSIAFSLSCHIQVWNFGKAGGGINEGAGGGGREGVWGWGFVSWF